MRKILVQRLSRTMRCANDEFHYNPYLNDFSVSEDFAAESGLFRRVIGVLGVSRRLEEMLRMTSTDTENSNSQYMSSRTSFQRQFYYL